MREVFRLVGKIALDGTVELNEKLSAIDKQANKVSRSLNRMGRDLMKIGKEFTKSITLPVVSAFGAVTKFGADFERTMTQSTAIMGDLSDEMRSKMETAAREVAKTTKFGATEAAQAFEFLALAGLDAEQSIAALPQVAAFAQAGNFDLARATDLATDAQSALGLASADATENLENMTRVTDVLTRVATLANANTEQFSEALTEKAGVALRNLKKDIEEGSAALAVYANQGVKGGQAGTILNATLEGLSRQAIINKDEFKALGIEVFDANGNMRNLADITADMENALGGMNTEQQRATLMQLGFNRQALNGLQMLMGNSEAMREYEIELRNAAGTTQQVADKQLKNFWDQLGLIKDRIIDVALTLWEEIEPVMMDVVIPALEAGADKLRALSEWFGNLSPPMKETVLALVALAVSFGPVLMIVGKLATGFGGLIPLFAKLVTGQLSLNAAMAANPIGVVVTAIYLLITAGILLWKNWDTVKNFMLDAWDAIVYGVQQAVSYLKVLVLSYIKMWVDGINIVAKYIPGLNGAIESAQNKLQDLIDAEKENIKYRREAREETKAQAKALKEAEEEAEKLKKAEEALTKVQQEQTDATISQTEAAKDLAEKREQFEKEWSDKLFRETATRIEILEAERKEALAEAEKLGADKADINAYYEKKITEIYEEEAEKRREKAEEEAKAREDFEKDWSDKLFRETASRIEILEAERDEALAKAEELGASKADILAYYEEKITEIHKEEAEKRREKAEEEVKAREDFEKRWSDKVFEETASRLEILEAERKEALAEAEKLGADITNIEKYYSMKRREIMDEEAEKAEEKAKQVKEAREAFEREWNQKYFELTADRMEILEAEMQDALAKAEELGASEAAIVAYYEQKKRELRRQTFSDYLSVASDMLGRLGSIFGQHYTNREKELENWYAKEKAAIEASQMSEEEKETAIKQLDEERDARKREMARKQAVSEKASALFSIAINTARAAIEALPNLVLSGIVTAMGAAQAALVAAEPLPALKTGGLAVGEVTAIVGDTPKRERGELILPMRTGVEMLADMLIGKLSQVALPRPAFAMAGGVSNAYDNRTEVHLHVGTLIADEPGLKKLERKLAEIRLMEDRRRGIR